ncbi:MAG: fumarylacetoacetate hydrolase family protein [Paludibacteraceae bacterium]|nr:fumarylacetoacetate hydrolase family protein [Paludibacteraceae bacterium]
MKIICIDNNYGSSALACPTIFLKPETALLKDNKPVYIPDFTESLEYEVEVTIRINRLGKGIAEKFANRYYAEVGLGIDFTARDMQMEACSSGEPWDLCKGFDCSAPISKFIPLTDLGGDVQNLDFRLDIDGKTVQSGNTKDMIFSVDKIISYISRFYTIKIGDILFTGTPSGVGAVSIGNHLEGWLCGRKMLDFYIK